MLYITEPKSVKAGKTRSRARAKRVTRGASIEGSAARRPSCYDAPAEFSSSRDIASPFSI